MNSDETPKAPVDQELAPTPQPVAQIQYVVQEKSLNGIGGFLIFWLIVFGLYGVGFLIAFFATLASVVDTGLPSGSVGAVAVETMIFGLLICVAYILSVVFIAMKKKLGKLMSFVSLALTALYIVILCITAMTAQICTTSYSYYTSGYGQEICRNRSTGDIIMLIGLILAALIYAGLVSLYFILSKRVKTTLIK